MPSGCADLENGAQDNRPGKPSHARGTCVANLPCMNQGGGILAELDGAELPVLLNAAAGSTEGEDTAKKLTEAFREVGVRSQVEILEPDAIDPKLRELAASGAKVVAIGGGDGSLSSAADTLAGSSTVLVPVPLGTLNHFARRYGIATLEAAATALRSGIIADVGVGEVNGHVFINNASCGFYPHLVRHREKIRPIITKWPAAVVAALMVLVRRPLIDLELEVQGKRIRRKTAAMWIGLGKDSLKLPGPGAATGEGDLLEIVLPRPRGRLALTALAWRLWWQLKQHQKPEDEGLEMLLARNFTLNARRGIDIATDGEVQRLPGPLHFRFHADALRVLCLIAPDETGTSAE